MKTTTKRWVLISLKPKSLDGNPVLLIDGSIDTPAQRANLKRLLDEEIAIGSTVTDIEVCDGRTIATLEHGKGIEFANRILGGAK